LFFLFMKRMIIYLILLLEVKKIF